MFLRVFFLLFGGGLAAGLGFVEAGTVFGFYFGGLGGEAGELFGS